MIGKPILILIPPDRRERGAGDLDRIRRGERVDHYETVRLRKDGTLVDISLSVSPIKDASGKVIGASKIARDITERKQAQERHELLTQEIHHRTKNIFSLVQAVVARSFADKATVSRGEEAVLSRLHSLAQTHVMLIDKEWQGADIAEVVRTEMSPYAGRVTIEGPASCSTPRRRRTSRSPCTSLRPMPQSTARCPAGPAVCISAGRCQAERPYASSCSHGRSAVDRK